MEKKRELVDLLRKLIKSLEKIRREKLKIIENNMTHEMKPIREIDLYKHFPDGENNQQALEDNAWSIEEKFNEIIKRISILEANQK